jgi:hypothetical protein
VKGKAVQYQASHAVFVKKPVGIMICVPVEDDDSIPLVTVLHTSPLDLLEQLFLTPQLKEIPTVAPGSQRPRMGLSPPPVVEDMRGDHYLSGGVILSDEVEVLKELQEIEVTHLGDAEESSFLD